jgi:hypothetical protein
MKLMMLITADFANVDSGTGKLNILGAFSRITTSDEFPKTWKRMALALKVQAEEFDHHNQRKLTIEMIDDDQNVHFHVSGPVSFPMSETGSPGEFNAVVELNGLVFPHPGFYYFVAKIDEEELGKTSIQAIYRPKS